MQSHHSGAKDLLKTNLEKNDASGEVLKKKKKKRPKKKKKIVLDIDSDSDNSDDSDEDNVRPIIFVPATVEVAARTALSKYIYHYSVLLFSEYYSLSIIL